MSSQHELAPKPGFDWRKVNWGRPDAVVSPLCSYCSASFKDEDVPLMLFSWDGHCAKFCDRCIERWWGGGPTPDAEPT